MMLIMGIGGGKMSKRGCISTEPCDNSWVQLMCIESLTQDGVERRLLAHFQCTILDLGG